MRKDIFFSILSALLLIFSFPNFNLWLFAWVGFVPLLIALKDKTPQQAFLLSYLAGIIFFSGILYWLIHVTLPGVPILVLYLALYFGIFGFLVCLCPMPYALCPMLFIPSIWVFLEYLRSHLFTGFSWALLGYSQYLNLPIIQIADITGVAGVSFLVMMVNVAIWQIILKVGVQGSRVEGQGLRVWFISLFCVLLTFLYGRYKLHSPFILHSSPIKISVIQGNIPQEKKWNPQLKEIILEKYIGLTKLALEDKPDLIIWPETALPGYLDEPWLNQGIVSLVKEIDTSLLVGTVIEEKAKTYNSAVLFSKEGSLIGRYDKLHLVPYGEYVPMPFSFLRKFVEIGDFSPGVEYSVFQVSNTQHLTAKFGVLICFEDIFPNLTRHFVQKDARFIINITNDAWFKRTSAPYQHLQASVFRAVENRVNLVRCANTGFSGAIDPLGRIIEKVCDTKGEEIFITGYKTIQIGLPRSTEKSLSKSIVQEKGVVRGLAKPKTFYTKFGDLFSLSCIFAVIVYLGFWRMKFVLT